jgi:photosystem II stability/assembly factor-like uncharacterized protein
MIRVLIIIILTCSFLQDSIAQWEPKNTIFGGNITDIIKFDSTLLISTRNGLYKSTNNGDIWTRINQESIHTVYNSIVLYDTVVYACGMNIFKSYDYGETWENISGDFSNSAKKDIEQKDSLLFLASLGGVFYSHLDSNWININGDKNFQILNNIEIADDRIYVSYYDSIWFSDNLGVDWFGISSTLFENSIINEMIVNDAVIYIATENGVFSSNNYGTSWFDETGNLTGYSRKVRRINIDSNILYIGTYKGVYKKTLIDTDWTSIESNLVNTTITAILPSDSMIFIGVDEEGIRRSMKDSICWEEQNKGIIGITLNEITTINDSLFIGTIGAGIYFSNDGGDTWVKRNNGLTNYNIKTIHIHNNILYAGSMKGLFSSNDYGVTWGNIVFPDTSVNAIYTADNILLIGTDYGVFKLNDLQNKFENYSNGLVEPIYDIVANSNYIFATTYYNNIYKSQILNNNWISTNFPECSSLYEMVVLNEVIFVGTWDGIVMSQDNGNTWEDCYYQANQPRKVLLVYDDKLFTGTNEVIYSDNYGYTWNYFSQNMELLHISDIVNSTSYFYSIANTGLIYKRNILDLGILDIYDDEIIKIYPNPTNNKFSIEYENIEYVEIFNEFGQLILKPKNYHDINLICQPNGVYFIKIVVDNLILTRKLIKQ